MEEKSQNISDNKEFLLANLLIENQQLKKQLEGAESLAHQKQQQFIEEHEACRNYKKELASYDLDKKNFSKSLLLKDKLIDVKALEINKLTSRLEKLQKTLQQQQAQSESQCKEKEQQVQVLQRDLNAKSSNSEAVSKQIGELEYQNRKYVYALRSAGHGLWDFHEGKQEFCFSASWCEMLGYQSKALYRDLETFVLMIHPEDKKQFRKSFETLLLKRTGEISEEIRIVNRNDQYVSVQFEGTYFKDEMGNNALSGISSFVVKAGEAAVDDALSEELASLKIALTNKDKSAEQHHQEVKQLQIQLQQEQTQNSLQLEKVKQLSSELEEKQVLLDIQAEEIGSLQNNKVPDTSEELAEKEMAVTQLTNQLNEIQQEYEFLKLIAQKTENAIIITNSNGAIEYVNEGFEQITEYTQSEVLGRKPGTFLQGQDTNPDHVKAIREGLNSKKPFKQEILNYSKSGRSYWLSLVITPIFDEQGNLTRYVAVERDITADKQRDDELAEAEEALRKLMEDQFIQSEQLIEKEQQLSEALEESERTRKEIENLSMVASKTDNAVIITDIHGSILYVNDGFERITEYSREEVMGRKPGTFLQGPATNPEHIRAIRDGLNSQKPFSQEILNYSKTGRPYWLNISINPIFNENGMIEKFIAIESDITEQKKQEENFRNLSLVASKTDNAVIITDRYGYIEWVNNGFEKLTEYQLEEVIGKKPGDFLQGSETRREDILALSQGIKSQKPFKQEIYNYSKSGRGYWLSISITPVLEEKVPWKNSSP